jgi:hypothetical protein
VQQQQPQPPRSVRIHVLKRCHSVPGHSHMHLPRNEFDVSMLVLDCSPLFGGNTKLQRNWQLVGTGANPESQHAQFLRDPLAFVETMYAGTAADATGQMPRPNTVQQGDADDDDQAQCSVLSKKDCMMMGCSWQGCSRRSDADSRRSGCVSLRRACSFDSDYALYDSMQIEWLDLQQGEAHVAFYKKALPDAALRWTKQHAHDAVNHADDSDDDTDDDDDEDDDDDDDELDKANKAELPRFTSQVVFDTATTPILLPTHIIMYSVDAVRVQPFLQRHGFVETRRFRHSHAADDSPYIVLLEQPQ